MKSPFRMFASYIVEPLLDTLITLVIFYVFVQLALNVNIWFIILPIFLWLGLAVKNSLAKMYLEDEKEEGPGENYSQ